MKLLKHRDVTDYGSWRRVVTLFLLVSQSWMSETVLAWSTAGYGGSCGSTFARLPSSRLPSSMPLSCSAQPDEAASQFHIRNSTYGDLGQVADTILASFYANATSPWSQLYRMGELNRVQQGFPYADKTLHRMLVAVVQTNEKKERVVGYCDIDARKPNQPTSYSWNPRPYLSDLCIHPAFRRLGIAQALVKICEDFCVQDIAKEEIFIRVEKTNVPALTMYQKMGYRPIENPDDPMGTIILLRKNLLLDDDSLQEPQAYSANQFC
jgi:ribosomal protein S18 acetylase RimI-like enzyme